MATLTADKIQVYFDLGISGAMTNINRIGHSFMNLQRIIRNTNHLRKMETDMRKLGLTATKTGQFIDILTGKFVAHQEVMERMDRLAQRGNVFGKRASEIGGIQDATPGRRGDSGQAQQLISAVTADAIIDSANAFHTMDVAAKEAAKSTSVLASEAQDIGVLMGFLFGGMTIQRWGQSIMRFVLPPMQQIQGYVSEGTKRINAMNASFEFLKFSMFETFTQTSLFRSFVDLFIRLSNSVAKFVQKNPAAALFLGAIGTSLLVIGKGMQLIGGVFQTAMLWKLLAGASTGKAVAGQVGNVTKKVTGLSKAFQGLGIVLSLATFAINFNDMLTNINKEDMVGAIANGIGSALGLAGAAAFVLGFGPAGLVLTLMGVLIWSATKLTADFRQVKAGATTILGEEKMKEIQQTIDDNLPLSARIASRIPYAKTGIYKDVGMTEGLKEYQKLAEMISQKDQEFAKIDLQDIESRVQANDRLLALKEDIGALEYAMFQLDPAAAATAIDSINFQIQAQRDASTATQDAADSYAPLISNIAESKTETENFNKNITSMTELLTGPEMNVAIKNVWTMDNLWMDATTHLTEFAEKLTEWASKSVTKTVWIEYKEKNKNKDTGGFFEKVGKNVDKVISSSVTG